MDALRPITLHSHRDMGMAIHQQEHTGIHPPAIPTIKVAITVCIYPSIATYLTYTLLG